MGQMKSFEDVAPKPKERDKTKNQGKETLDRT